MTTGGGNYWASGSLPLIEPEFLGSIIAAASDIALVVSSEGEVLSVLVNSNDESFGNLAHWEGRALAEFLTAESIEKFQTAHAAYLHSAGDARPIELNHVDNAAWQHPVRYTFHRFGQENCVLLLGRDLRPIAETQQQLVQAQIAMEQGYEAQREFDARYRVILGGVDDAVVFVDLTTGRVDEANEKAASLVGLKPEAMEGSSFSGLFDPIGNTDLTDALVSATLDDETDPIEVRSTRSGTKARITPTLFRAGGRRMLMCILAPEAIAAAMPEEGNTRMSAMFQDSGDAMIFVRPDGEILAANDTFIDMIGATRRGDVPGSNFSEMLVRGQIDLSLMVGNAGKTGQMRVYATRLIDKLGTKINVEASVTKIDEDGTALFGLIMRDVNRLDAVRSKQVDDPAVTASGQRVVELVGSASLRDIVAETTDVVEKMCIETAVALTRNNRVAAAEMLGLSRQSLYVKLRKYGLLERN